MANNKNEEIRSLIAREFDTRLEAAVFTYILDCGIEKLSKSTEDDIEKVKGNDMMSDSFIQALVRVAVEICKKFTGMEIMTYIRMACNFAPFPSKLELYKEDYSEIGWEEICDALDLDGDEEDQMISILVINEEFEEDIQHD